MTVVEFTLNNKQEDGTYLFKYKDHECINHKSNIFRLAIGEDCNVEESISYVDKRYYSSMKYDNN